ncbi:hypothetical protein [Nonomuraea jiangxiensis]|nr:hypothetical protein [Nonomuraea jiangxiensis]
MRLLYEQESREVDVHGPWAADQVFEDPLPISPGHVDGSAVLVGIALERE